MYFITFLLFCHVIWIHITPHIVLTQNANCAVVPVGQNTKCMDKFAKNSIHTNRSVEIFEARTTHVASLCVAVLATVGLLVCVSIYAHKRLRADGALNLADSPPAAARLEQVERSASVHNGQTRMARDSDVHLTWPTAHDLRKADDSAAPEIQVILPSAEFPAPVWRSGAASECKRRHSI